MKQPIIHFLQKILGIKNYLFIFSVFKIWHLKFDKREKDFLLFMKNIKPGGIILDVGANIGFMTYHLSKRFSSSKIYSFEPVPQNASNIKRLVKLFKLPNVKIFEFALGEKQSKMQMVLPEVKNTKFFGLSHILHDSIKEFNEGEKIEVNLTPLDSIEELETTQLNINAIKIDVENYEKFVLQGGEEIIKKHRPFIVMELWNDRYGDNKKLCFDFFKYLNYDVKVRLENSLIPYDPNRDFGNSFFFVPRSV